MCNENIGKIITINSHSAKWGSKMNLAKELGEATFLAIVTYANMSRRLRASEGFIRDLCALRLHEISGQLVSTELPLRTFVSDWSIDRAHLSNLGNFRVDMALYSNVTRANGIDVETLVEFKLWTDRYKASREIRRIKQIAKAIDMMEESDSVYKTRGYLVVCPQYQQGLDAAREALSDFERYFPVSFKKEGEIALQGRTPFGVGVIVIDINECTDGWYG